MKTELFKPEAETALPAVQRPTDINSLLMVAVERGTDAAALEKLVDLQLKIMAKNAEMAFNAAFQQFQSACPPVTKNKTADTGKFKYDYADLSHIAETVAPALRDNGLSYTFDSEVTETTATIICTLHHVDGHSRSARVVLPVYKFEKINSLQCEGVRNSYGKRYALMGVLGITTGDSDTDGRLPADANRPDRNDDAPTAQPRADRVKPEECKAIMERYMKAIGGDRDGFEAWVVETAAMSREDVSRPSMWTRQALEHCDQKLKRAEASHHER